MDTRLALHALGEQAQRRVSDLSRSLAAVHVQVVAHDASDAHARAVLFDRVEPALYELLHELRCQRARVLALACGPEPLAGSVPFQMLRAGASEVLAWDDSTGLCASIAARLQRWREVDAVVDSELVQRNAVGRSPSWCDCMRRVVEIAMFARGPLLLTGESGTGKELVARLVHALDPRPNKGELVVLDCTTVVRELAGSEFFGHERGAFTGAVQARDGAFALADRGTLFLDEVGELPPALQAQLLRVVQERTYKHVGGNTWHRTTFRLICATNRDLEVEISRGDFRADFFHRIAHTRCQLPPLRERGDDVLLLVEHFLREFCAQPRAPKLAPVVMRYLVDRAYNGNVRELRHLIGRICDRHVGAGALSVGDLPPEDLATLELTSSEEWPDSSVETMVSRALTMGIGLKELSRVTSDAAIRLALAAEGGNLQRAARLLKVTDRALQMRRAQGAA